MNVRCATKSDIDAIASLELSCFDDPWSKEDLKSCMDKDFYDIFVIEEDKVVGYFITMTVDDCELLRICVDNEYRSKGLGTSLMQKLIQVQQEKGIGRVLLEVRHTNQSAIRLYKKFQFTEFGVRKNYYGGNIDARLFERTLTDKLY